MQKEALQASCPNMCTHKKEWQINPLRNNDDWKTKEFEDYKKNEQREKLGTINLLMLEGPWR